MKLDTEAKMDLITRHLDECMGEGDLRALIEENKVLKHYIGFEISGKIHIGTGLQCLGKVKDLMDAGVECTIFLADWHSWINDKLGGDRDVIKTTAVGYFKEGLKASLKCLGGDPDKLKFMLGTDLYSQSSEDYWATVIEVSKNTTLNRIIRSTTIMGRKEGENIDFAKLIYPPMQVADIFIQGVHLPHAGLDQRKAHVIARDVALKLKIRPLKNDKGETIKPVALHHHLILGLQKPSMWPVDPDKLQELWSSMKMSKSHPDSAIFITDSPDEIRRKLNKAFCPEKEVQFNPVLDWVKYLVFREPGTVFEIKRPEKYGGDKMYASYSDVEDDFKNGALHPADLKKGTAEALVSMLEPARKHFEDPKVSALKEAMEKLVVTR